MKNLKKLRKENNLSQQQLADIIHTSQQSIYKYENGITSPNLETLIKTADYFNTSVDYLIGHTNVSKKISSLPIQIFNVEETTLIQKYKKLSPHTKKVIIHIIDEFLDIISIK